MTCFQVNLGWTIHSISKQTTGQSSHVLLECLSNVPVSGPGFLASYVLDLCITFQVVLTYTQEVLLVGEARALSGGQTQSTPVSMEVIKFHNVGSTAALEQSWPLVTWPLVASRTTHLFVGKGICKATLFNVCNQVVDGILCTSLTNGWHGSFEEVLVGLSFDVGLLATLVVHLLCCSIKLFYFISSLLDVLWINVVVDALLVPFDLVHC